MIQDCSGDIFEAETDAIVNPVNCVGVSGKGLALGFRRRYPVNFHLYVEACKRGQMRPGMVQVTARVPKPYYVINFPTKRHWRDPSRLEDIRAGLGSLVEAIADYGIRSVAVPALGAGLGGLPWEEVRPLIVSALGAIKDLDVRLYGPR